MNRTSSFLRRSGQPAVSSPSMLEQLEARNLLAVDLVAAFINVGPHTLAPGEDFSAAMVVNNDGNDDSPGFSVEMRLSSDGIFGNADDVVLGTAERPAGIAGNFSASLVRTFSIPEGTEPGSYFLAFFVDHQNEVVESDETNNTVFSLSQSITVTPGGGGNVDLDVFGNGQEISDGAHIPSADNHTFFGDVDIGEFQERTFTLLNDGSGTLQILGVTITGAHSLDFVVLGNPVSSVAPGQSISLMLRFAPLAEGIRIGSVQIQTNDTDDGTGDPSVFTFAISGAGHEAGDPTPTFPEIEVRGNGLVIASGDNAPRPADNTGFGALRPANASITRTFTIFNTGDGTLNITGLQIAGRNPGDFTIIGSIDSIAAGESASFQVRFDPTSLGRKIGQVRILSDDADEGLYFFRIAGRGAVNGGIGDASPAIDVQGNSVSIMNGDTSPAAIDRTKFGQVRVEDQTRTRIYTIHNTGSGELNIASISLFGRNASDYEIIAQPTSVAAGESAQLRVRFDPSALGARIANVRIISNDLNDGEYTFRIRGGGVNLNPPQGGEAQIAVTGILPLANDDVTPRLFEGTHYGPVNVGESETRTFTITNVGTGVLNLTGSFVELTGRNAPRFSIVQMPDTSIAVGESTTLVIQFNPVGLAAKRATVQIFSNDADDAIFSFDLAGRGRLA